MIFRQAKLEDIKKIQEIERKYYEGFNCPLKTLEEWIKNLPENFIVAEQNKKIIGFIFFEYLNETKAVPFIHTLEHKKDGRFVYVSEVGVLDRHENVLQQLLDKLIEKAIKDDCKKIIWLTGQKYKHDKLESKILKQNNFTKLKKVFEWEYYPNKFVSDHWLWEKII